MSPSTTTTPSIISTTNTSVDILPSPSSITTTTTTTTKKTNNKKISATAKGIAGSIAGGVEIICVWPLESTKTKLQLQRKLAKQAGVGYKPPFTGMISCFQYTIRSTGFLSLYHGMLPVLLGSVPKAGLRFGVFEKLNQLFVKPDGTTTSLRTLAAGSTAGAIESLLVVTPVETVKTKLIDLKMGTVAGTRHILATEGFRGVYRGALATTLKQGSNQGLRFMAFEWYKKRIIAYRGGNSSSTGSLDPGTAMVGGMFAGMFSTLLNNPFDFLKTRLQGTEATKLYTSSFDCLKKTIQQEGVLQLWSGVVPRLARVVPGQGIIFASSETLARMISVNFNV
jgi:solute carrier family 25 citrate transporter 1